MGSCENIRRGGGPRSGGTISRELRIHEESDEPTTIRGLDRRGELEHAGHRRGAGEAGRTQRPIVVASGNGLRAVEKAMELVRKGHDPLDAAIEGVAIVEADPKDNSVGYGGLPNEDGVVELDAAVMHGPTHGGGSVASIRNIMHPAAVARLVMQRTRHCLLVGEGALRFARAHGFPEINLLTEESRQIWLHWKETRDPKDDWLPPPDETVAAFVREAWPTGSPARSTVRCLIPTVTWAVPPRLQACHGRFPVASAIRRSWGPACFSTMRSARPARPASAS